MPREARDVRTPRERREAGPALRPGKPPPFPVRPMARPKRQTPSKQMTKICAQCEMEHSADGLMEQMCSSDFVVKMRIKEIKIENGDRKLIGAQKKKKLLKPGPLKRKDTKRLVLHMKNGASCPCPQLDSLAGSFLVMGRKVDGQLLLMAVYRWDKKNKEMKFAVKFMFSYPCSLYYPFFYGAAEPH
ncbi:secreted frizzled-related protein 5 [Puma concolor]|uniref:Secreted frizzled-related protein 5 n=1 Tax=Puma concolor TaxID=9696 RepID=A0A6P6HCT3_PUMCO|nr:secreted frizzled-related protein 5 [Puma concolor]